MSKKTTFLVRDFFNVCVVLFKRSEGPYHISSTFLTAQGRKSIDIYIYKDDDKNTNSENTGVFLLVNASPPALREYN